MKKREDEKFNAYDIPLDDFFHFALSVDCVVFGFDNKDLKILLIERGVEPMKDLWALPGDLVRLEEGIEVSANNILKKLTGVNNIYLKQVHTFGKVDRHPLGRVITTAFYALVDISKIEISPSSWASQTKWYKVSELPQLAFDHRQIISTCINQLERDAKLQPIGFELLPKKFPLGLFQELYEAIYQTTLDKSNFRKKVKSLNILNQLDEFEKNVSHRPGKLYQFDKKRYNELKEKGFLFEIGV